MPYFDLNYGIEFFYCFLCLNFKQNFGESAIGTKVKGEEVAIHLGAREECNYITGKLWGLRLRA